MKIMCKALAATVIILFATSCSKDISNSPSSVNTHVSSNYSANDITHFIGESFGGGIVFYVDSSGMHGLIAAPENQSSEIAWNIDSSYTVAGASRSNIGAGRGNTKKIINAQGRTGNYAALLCAGYRGGGFADWFLPSKNELFQLSEHKDVISGLTGGNYWSSTEKDSVSAWFVHFHRSIIFQTDKSTLYHVRAVRMF